MRRAWRGRHARVAFALAALLAATPAAARDRLMRAYDERTGLPVSEIMELAQDSTGFLWVGTSGGLVRFDGREMREWAPGRVRHVVRAVSCSPDGEVLVAAADEPLWLVTMQGMRPLAGPGGRRVDDWVHASFDRAGDLWALSSGMLRVRDTRGVWRTLDSTAFDASPFFRVRPWTRDTVFVATERALWRLTPHGVPERVAALPRVQDVAALPDGRIAVLTRDARLVMVGRDGTRELLRGAERGNAMVSRAGVLWLTIDRYLLRVAPGAPPDTVAPTATTPTGRPLLVDREGSLWLGGYHGLLQFPEPETVVWDARDGMPSPTHAFGVHHDGEGVWVSTWYGATEIPEGGARRARALGRVSGGFFGDGAGDLWWAAIDRGFMRRHRGVDRFIARPGLHRIAAAAPRPDGTLWLATDDGLFITPRGSGAPRAVATPPPPELGATWRDSWIEAVALDRRGELWIGQDERIAHASADSIAAGLPVAWRVERLPGAEQVNALVEMPSGAVWAATADGGMWRHAVGGAWEPIPGSRTLASPRVYDLAPSPAGGLWVLADGDIVRVRERADLPEGWEAIEHLTSWQGAPSRQAGGLVELPDGRIWLASLAGVVEMPASARHAPKHAPAMALVDERVDGRSQPLDRGLRLPWNRNRLELRFAALSYRDRSLLRYQYRLKPGAPWTESLDPDIHAVDLSPGDYDIEVRASLDGADWTEPPAMVRFAVMAPWYRQGWAMALALLLVAAALWTAHRIRVGMLLRLERQRTRIAMDLHDEMGSGLGSIGILAGLASEPELDDGTRRQLAGQIAEAAGELGGSLSDIVWSLRADAGTLEAFAFRLAERGGRLFPDPPPAFATRFPERWPVTHLTHGLRRQLQFIALEALHNAAKHARARHVTLGLAPEDGRWRLWVEDDGCGLAAAAPASLARGNGLGNLRRRADAIGATLEMSRPAGGGTRMDLVFDPAADPARTRRGEVA